MPLPTNEREDEVLQLLSRADCQGLSEEEEALCDEWLAPRYAMLADLYRRFPGADPRMCIERLTRIIEPARIRGSRPPRIRNKRDVVHIRRLHAGGMSMDAIADEYGCDRGTIQSVIRRRGAYSR